MATRNGNSSVGKSPEPNGNHSANGKITDSMVIGQTSQGNELRATLLRLTRYMAVFEIYDPGLILRRSEAFEDFKIILHDRTIYSGRAIVRNLMDAGLMFICEVQLDESSWADVQVNSTVCLNGELRAEFKQFIEEWQRLYKIQPEFKLAIADMQSFLSNLRLWLEQVELSVRSQPTGDREAFMREALGALQEPVLSSLGLLFERFEQAASNIDLPLQPAHSVYAQRQLHPLVLCAPFMYRTFQKPLGYAGDYEMVNMMVRDSYQGSSVFAKMLNTFFLSTPPVAAHRNRIDYLKELLVREGHRTARQGLAAKVLNLGCGPALEVQAYLQSPLNPRTEFTLLDFNDETVRHTEQTLNQIKSQHQGDALIRVIRKSVTQVLKENSASFSKLGNSQYDLVYCAGLFDYLIDPVCSKLLGIFYHLTAPGGAVVVTNVDRYNPSKGWMEYVVDWHLIYRSSQELVALIPPQIPRDALRVFAEPSGVNVIVEIRKPLNA